MDADVVVTLITKSIQFFAAHGLPTAVHGQNVPAQAVNGIGPCRGGGRICRIPSFHSNRARSSQSRRAGSVSAVEEDIAIGPKDAPFPISLLHSGARLCCLEANGI